MKDRCENERRATLHRSLLRSKRKPPCATRSATTRAAHALNWARHILRKYGLTVENYAWMLHAQNFGCAICGKHPEGKLLAVDHNHKTGEVRGLVCTYCNWKVLGQIERGGFIRAWNAIGYLWPKLVGKKFDGC